MKFIVIQNGKGGQAEVDAITAQDAIEQHFGIIVLPYDIKGEWWIFDDINLNQLYAAAEIRQMTNMTHCNE